MKLLIVEDDENTIAMFDTELRRTGHCVPFFARSKDSALTVLQSDKFDLVILDLKIPTQDGSLDSDVSHGLAVHSFIQVHTGGTPILVFSANGTFTTASKLVESSGRHDIWGAGQETALTACRDKSELSDCLAHIEAVFAHIDALSAIDISTGGIELGLNEDQKRILRIYSRMTAGSNARLSSLGGGLSDAKTVRIEVQNSNSQITSLAVAKLGSLESLRDEERRYNTCIGPALAAGGFAPLIRSVRAGACKTGGIFYSFAKDYRESLLDVLNKDPAQAAQTITELKRLEATWQRNAIAKTIAVGDLRRTMISDDEFQPKADLLSFDWRALERTSVRIKWCCQHCDLHSLNVLVMDGETPLIIDYGSVESGPACLDPLILEMSLLFHPACSPVRQAWPPVDQASQWGNLDAYVKDCRLAPFVQACRAWAFEVEPVDKSVFATAYAFAVRQFKFPNVSEDLINAVSKSAFDAYMR